MAAINHPSGHFRRGLPLPASNARLNFWLVVCISFAALCALLPVVQNSLATSRGFDIQASQRQESELNGQIGVLQSDVANLTSITRIERRALEIGLAPATDPIYVSVNEPGPAPAKLPSEYLPPVQTKKSSPSPFWKPLVRWLP
jgi:hypothetical protein